MSRTPVAPPSQPPSTHSPGSISDALGRLVPAAVQEVLRNRHLEVRRPVWGRRHGRHTAARAGLGLDFRDHRPYVPGDDPRRIDWRAVARHERLVLRRTQSEDERSLTLMVDTSGGMDYGEGAEHKLRYAHAIAGALAWLAHRQADPVGLAIGRAPTADLSLAQPRSGQERLSAIARLLLDTPPQGRCPWTSWLEATAPRLPRRSLVVVLSDFLDLGTQADDADHVQQAVLRALALLRARHHDIVLVQLLHRDELTFPWADRGMVRFDDLRGVHRPLEAPGRSLRAAYLQRLRAHLRTLDERCDAEGLVLWRNATDTPAEHALIELLGRLAGEPPHHVVEVAP